MSFINRPILRAAGVFLLIAFLALVPAFLTACRSKKTDPRLASPELTLHEILNEGTPLFLSPEFFPFVPSANKALIPTREEALSASKDKTLFWKLNREHHFSMVFLGPSPLWNSLEDSLLSSPLWILSEVSPWGYLFKHATTDAPAWKIPSEETLKNQWPDPSDRARFLILTAANLQALNRIPEAGELLEMAAATHRLPSLVLSSQASLSASRGRWEESAALARKSLQADHHNLPARKILTRALIETGETDAALDAARQMAAENTQDEEALFLLARAANASNSGQEEIDSLSRLASLERTNHEPAGVILTYLGQAYAKNGERGAALRTFQEALLCPELSDKEQSSIREIMDHLMEGNASSTTLPPLKVPQTNNR